MGKNKTLVIIGNGFDLAHTLNTRYTDFLSYVEKNIEKIKSHEDLKKDAKNIFKIANLGNDYIMAKENNEENNEFEDYDYKDLKFEEIDDIIHNEKNMKSLSRKIFMYIYDHENYWLNYFKDVVISYDWVDFEEELQNIVKILEKFILGNKLDEYESKKMRNIVRKDFYDYDYIIKALVPKLLLDLKLLIYLLEYYLIIESKKVMMNENIDKLVRNVDGVITYNYTQVFEKLYNTNNLKIYHIHGELKRHNLVLGVGETLDDNNINKCVICSGFKKYFQKVYFGLGDNYKSLLGYKDNDPCRNEIDRYRNRMSEKWNVIIYGHSLAVSDKDSLEWVITHPLVEKITIYYYDYKSLNQLIANASLILGKDCLLQMVEQKKIYFAKC